MGFCEVKYRREGTAHTKDGSVGIDLFNRVQIWE